MGPFEMNVKIEQGSDFDVDNGSGLFFDAQEAKMVSECTDREFYLATIATGSVYGCCTD